MAVKPGDLKAFTAENGEGKTDENGEVVYRYGPADVVAPCLESFQLMQRNEKEGSPGAPGGGMPGRV